MGMKITFSYFKEQHHISMIDLAKNDKLPSLKCLEGEIYRSVHVFSSFKTLKVRPKLFENSLVDYPSLVGIYVKCNKEFVLNGFLERMSNYNPVMKLMFQFSDQSFETAKEILQFGFEKYKILNAAVLVLKSFQAVNQPLTSMDSLCLYNPFRYQTPDFHCINFTTENLNEQLIDMEKFIKMRVTNLQQFPLKIDIFPYPMVSKPIIDNDSKVLRYSYVDGSMINAISKVMNFTPIYLTPSTNSDYGTRLPNGTFTGSLAALEYGKADFVANPRLISSFPTTKAVFLKSTIVWKYKFIIHRLKKRRNGVPIVQWFYDKPSQIISVIISLSFPVIYFLTVAVNGKILKKKHDSFIKCCLKTNAILCGISVTQPRCSSTRIVFYIAVFYSLIFTSIYQGLLVKNLNADHNSGAVKTIDDLFERGYKLVMTRTLNHIFKQQSGGKLAEKLKRLSSEKEGVNTEDGIHALIADKKVAFLWADIYTSGYLNRFYDNETGENIFQVVPETAFEFFIAPMAPKASPFLEKFNEIIMRFVEAGLHIHHLNLAVYENDGVLIDRIKKGFIPKHLSRALKFQDLKTIFIIICCLLFLSFLVFLIELIFVKHFKKFK